MKKGSDPNTTNTTILCQYYDPNTIRCCCSQHNQGEIMNIIHFAGRRTSLLTRGLLSIAILLQGCANYGGPLSQFIYDKAFGVIGFPDAVESAQFDSARKEFVICISGVSNAEKEKFTIIIPEDLVAKGDDDRNSLSINRIFDIKKRTGGVLKKRSAFLQAYKLATRVEHGCRIVSTSFNPIPIIRASEFDNAPSEFNNPSIHSLISFDGEIIKAMLAKENSFVVLIPDRYRKYTDSESLKTAPCKLGYSHPCLLVASKISSANHSAHEIRNDLNWEIFSIEEFTSNEYSNLLWYPALPFANVIEFTLLGSWLVAIGAGAVVLGVIMLPM